MSGEVVYETTLNILREAGFVQEQTDENVVADGAVIHLAHGNLISPTKDNAVATADDILVLVDGVSVTVSGIEPVKGVITLAAAPAKGASISVKYYYAPIAVDFVKICRQDVQCAINTKMRGVDPCAPYTTENLPYCVRLITRLWAAGLIMAKAYGYVTDDALEAKDGYKKIEEAKSLLEDLYSIGGACEGDGDGQLDNHGGTGAVKAEDDGDLFKKPNEGCRELGDLGFNIC